MVGRYDWVFSSRALVRSAGYVVEVMRNNEWVADYPVVFNNHRNAVEFMRETYGTDIVPLYGEETRAVIFTDKCGNRFAVSSVCVLGDRL